MFHRNARITNLWSRDHIYSINLVTWQNLLVTSKNYDVITFNLKCFTFSLRRSRVTIFADIVKIVTIFIKTIQKDSKKVIRIWNYVSKCSLYLPFLIKQNLLISGEKMLISAELKCCFWILITSKKSSYAVSEKTYTLPT